MKSLFIAFGACLGMALGGCVTMQGLETPEAHHARQMMVEHCVVGQALEGTSPQGISFVRLNRHSLQAPHATNVTHRHDMDLDRITVFSIQDRPNGWRAVDAASMHVRDNFYYNPQTGAFACSTDEWRMGDFTPSLSL